MGIPSEEFLDVLTGGGRVSLRPVELVGQEHACKGAAKDDQAWKHSTPGTRRKPVLVSI